MVRRRDYGSISGICVLGNRWSWKQKVGVSGEQRNSDRLSGNLFHLRQTIGSRASLVFGTAGRELSEKDGLKVPVCNDCHNMGDILCRIHGNPMAERMSKIIGQLAWEKEYALQKADEFARIIDADRKEGEIKQVIHKGGRETFRKRYGCSYL